MKKGSRVAAYLLCFIFLVCALMPTSANAQSYSKGTISADNVAFRKSASDNSNLICRLSAGTVVTVLSTNVNAEWHKIRYEGKTGFVNRLYVNLDASLPAYDRTYSGIVVNCKEFVNVRASASKSSKTIGKAKLGSSWTVTAANVANNWHEIDYNGTKGYINGSYLSLTAKADRTQLTSLTVSNGIMTPAFSPDVTGYIVRVNSDKVTLSCTANAGVKIGMNDNGKSTYTFSMPEHGSKTVRIKVGSKVRYTVYLVRGAFIVGTWNIKRGNNQLIEQGRAIEQQQMDFLALQEVYKNSGANKTDNLLSLRTKDMQNISFAKSIDYPGGGQYGIGMISRYKLMDISTTKLDSGSFEPRILQRAVITVDKKTVSVYNTHFSFNSKAIRKKQFAQVLKVMNADKNPYKILFGDFNAAFSEFGQLKGYDPVNTSGTQYLNYEEKTIHKNEIDNILVTPNITVLNSIMLDVNYSDHKPLIAFLVLN